MNKPSFLAGVIVTVACYFALSEFIQNKNTPGPFDSSAKDASTWTKDYNQKLRDDLNFDADPAQDAATEGLVRMFRKNIKDESKTSVVWNREDFDFLDSMTVESDEEFTINPSLLRQAKLNNEAGLYKIRTGVYQVRGLDLAVMSFIRGTNGWIVVDPLTSKETAAKGMELFFNFLKHNSSAPPEDTGVPVAVSAVIFYALSYRSLWWHIRRAGQG